MRRLCTGLVLLVALALGCEKPSPSPRQVDLLASLDRWSRRPAPPAPRTEATHSPGSLEFVEVGGELRRCLRTGADSTYGYGLVVPAGARFRVGFGIEDREWNDPGSGLSIQIALETADGTQRLSRRRIEPASARQRRWLNLDVALEKYAGREVTLLLETDSPADRGRTRPGDHACWANPTIYVPETDATLGGPPNVFILTIDTLRSDHLGAYGYSRPTSPHIDALAADGVLFENAFTTVPRTTPALASLMTGRYPRAHGVMRLWDRLSAGQKTLADAFKERGYATGAVVTFNTSRESGLNQGFDTFSDRWHARGKPHNRGHILLAEALDWVTQRQHLRMFFWLHLLEPHFPYNPPAPQRRAFAAGHGSGFDLYERLGRGDISNGQVYFENDLSPAHLRHMTDLYDGEIHRADELIGTFLDRLRELGLYEDALIILTSDHGESLGEHDYYFEHGDYLYDPELRIPLVIRFPGNGERNVRVAEQVSILDIPSTILAVAGIDTAEMRGRDLRSSLVQDDRREPLFSETGHRFFEQNRRRYLPGIEGNWKSVRDGRWKLIEIPTGSEPLYELYDLETNPLESKNLYSENPELASRMRESLHDWLAAFEGHRGPDEETGPTINRETAERLRALGYMDRD